MLKLSNNFFRKSLSEECIVLKLSQMLNMLSLCLEYICILKVNSPFAHLYSAPCEVYVKYGHNKIF